MSYLEKQRIRRAETNNASTKKYERTKKGKLMRTYRNMMNRTKGIIHKGVHLYKELDLLSREDFYNFSLNDNEFNRIYDEWVKSEYDRKLSPSIDRIDTTKGYVIGNIRWLTHSENSKNGGHWRPKI